MSNFGEVKYALLVKVKEL